jgi:ribonuclease T
MQKMPASPPVYDFSQEICCYISVDVEASGPNPGGYSLLSIGACTVTKPRSSFYVELRPVNEGFTPEAMAINGLSLEELAVRGLPPSEAMASFERWLQQLPGATKPIFVAFNAAFDWMFVCDYFHRYLGRNPFGHSPLDIKALYMGLHGVTWAESTLRHAIGRYLHSQPLTHHALDDATVQADIFETMLNELTSRR